MDIKEQIHGLSEEMIENLGKLVAIDSQLAEAKEGKPFGEGPAEALRVGLEIAEGLGFRTVNLDNYCGYAEIVEIDGAKAQSISTITVVMQKWARGMRSLVSQDIWMWSRPAVTGHTILLP